MISAPPKAFLDTQIIVEAERRKITQDEWSLASGYLRNATRYCISPLTVGELISALVNGDSEHFELHQRRLRVLLSPGDQAEVFDFAPYFVAQALGLPVERPAHLEDDFLGSINLILEAPSKDSLLQGFRCRGKNSKQIAKIRIDRFAKEHASPKEGYISHMTLRKERNITSVSPDAWASSLLRFYGISRDDVALAEVAERLSANYEFEMYVNNLVQNENFTISKNTSDLIDGQQLCYLCDPNVVFITNDSDFKNRTQNSPQANRIKTFAELLACATSKSPLL